MNIASTLVATARRFPQRPAVTWGATSCTYAQLADRVGHVAGGLRGLGVGPGDRVAVFMRNRPELLEAMYATFQLGACLVPLNARLTADEVTYHCADAGVRAVVTEARGIDVVAAADVGDAAVVVVGDADDAPTWPARDGWVQLDVLMATAAPVTSPVDVDRDDLAWLFYTSGTTGRPKGAMLTHGCLTFVTVAWLADLTPLSERDVTLHAAPLTHGAGFHALAATARGAHQIVAAGERFVADEVLSLIADQHVTNTWMVPTQIVMLTDALATRPRAGLSSLRHLVYGGAPFPESELRRALDALGPVLVQLYAQGETPMTATMLSAPDHLACLAGDHPERLASAGFARPGVEITVRDPAGAELPSGKVGEICVRGPSLMLGYWERPDESAAALAGGWLHTGDLGRMDEAGCVFVLDRVKDLIITGGSNVYAVEVETVLAAHPAVRDVAVVGVPDRVWGEIVVAAIVSDADADELAEELGALSERSLAAYKRPRRYVKVGALRRNAYGKVLKRELRTELAAGA